MRGEQRVSVGANIGYGLLFITITAVAIGFGTIISIIISKSYYSSFAFEAVFVSIFCVPILVLIIGIVQGRMALGSNEALIAGGVTGAVGYFIFFIIMVGTFMIGVSIKSPYLTYLDLGEIFGPLITGFIHVGIIGALAAYFSIRFIFPPATPYMPPYPQVPPVSQPGYEPTLTQQTQYSQQSSQQQQQQQRFGRFGCPNCGNAFVAQIPDRPTMTKCTSCGAEVIIEPPY